MCGKYELNTRFRELPSLLKRNPPKGFEQNYAQQKLITPNNPVLVLKNEGKTATSIMLWGFIPEWSKDPFRDDRPRPFNSKAETVGEKSFFKGSWRYKRCLLPASGFFEKGHRISRIDEEPFWLGGIWSRWMSDDGSELESCCVLTTKSNNLLKTLHNRMPVVIPNGLEEEWIASVKDVAELKALETMINNWNPSEWVAKPINKIGPNQLSLF